MKQCEVSEASQFALPWNRRWGPPSLSSWCHSVRGERLTFLNTLSVSCQVVVYGGEEGKCSCRSQNPPYFSWFHQCGSLFGVAVCVIAVVSISRMNKEKKIICSLYTAPIPFFHVLRAFICIGRERERGRSWCEVAQKEINEEALDALWRQPVLR